MEKKFQKKDLVDILVVKMKEITVEQEKLSKKLKLIEELLVKLKEEPDADLGPGDLDMDEDVDYEDEEDDEFIEYEGVIYKLGQTVQLKDCKSKKWKGKGKLMKFNEKTAYIQLPGGGRTRRNYGNFRHFPEVRSE